MFSSKTVAELKAECKSRGLTVTGKKQDLIDRLTANENEKSMEDDLLEEPDVSLGEESQEQPAEEPEKTEEAPEETTEAPKEDSPKPAEETPDDDMEQKKLERAKKFGIEAPELIADKKKSRAERFGLTAEKKADPVKEELDAKKKSRAERFGLNINQKRKAKLEGTDIAIDAEKLKKRQERFGNVSTTTTTTTTGAANGVMDEKKAARAARFAQKV